MFNWVKTIFTGITNWVTGGGGGVVGAISQTALKGAVSGAIIGAATSAIKGDDILKGALKGAAYGGVAGGVVGSIGQMSGMGTTNQIADVGGNVGDTYDSSGFVPEQTSGGSIGSDGLLSSSSPSEASGMSLGTKNIIAQAGMGALQAYGGVKAEETRAENEDKLLDKKEQIRKDRIAANKPGDMPEIPVAKIATWWDTHLSKPNQESPGLLTDIGDNNAAVA